MIMRKITVLAIMIMSSSVAFAQPSSYDTLWTRTYGFVYWDAAFSVKQTPDGGYLLAGGANLGAPQGYDCCVVKTDSVGDALWTRTYGGTDYQTATSCVQTPEGDFVMAGYTYGHAPNDWDVYVLKINSYGDSLWSRTFGGDGDDRAESIVQTSEGDFMITGKTESFADSITDVYVIKIDTNGDSIWARNYGFNHYDFSHSIKETSDGGYIISGESWDTDVRRWFIYLLKIDNMGDIIWERRIAGYVYIFGKSVVETYDNGYVVAGRVDYRDHRRNDVFIMKTDAFGDSLWAYSYYGVLDDYGESVQKTPDGGFIIAGYTSVPRFDTKSYFIKTDRDGGLEWTRTYGGEYDEVLYSIECTPDGGFIASGYKYFSYPAQADAYLMKISGDIPVGVEDTVHQPVICALGDNYPNPFNASTAINFNLPENQPVRLEIFNISGQLVETLLDNRMDADHYTIQWNADGFSSGIYFYRLTTGKKVFTKKMTLLK
jgi:hypothetical protein